MTEITGGAQPRPRCPYCNRPLALWTRSVSRPASEPRFKTGDVVTIDDAKQTVLKVTYQRTDPDVFLPAARKHHADVWCGGYWSRYDKFDRLRCALLFALAAYQGGYRIVRKGTQ